ncbi:hypothetical protein L208DRAFT_1392774 [Tricholoma matsutake]|nr:hypothetical protein L208DRAFT_1392774 [Tricholoma matsutake 945]
MGPLGSWWAEYGLKKAKFSLTLARLDDKGFGPDWPVALKALERTLWTIASPWSEHTE